MIREGLEIENQMVPQQYDKVVTDSDYTLSECVLMHVAPYISCTLTLDSNSRDRFFKKNVLTYSDLTIGS